MEIDELWEKVTTEFSYQSSIFFFCEMGSVIYF